MVYKTLRGMQGLQGVQHMPALDDICKCQTTWRERVEKGGKKGGTWRDMKGRNDRARDLAAQRV